MAYILLPSPGGDGHLFRLHSALYIGSICFPLNCSGLAFPARPCCDSLGIIINAPSLTMLGIYTQKWRRGLYSLPKGTCLTGSPGAPLPVAWKLFCLGSSPLFLHRLAGKRCYNTALCCCRTQVASGKLRFCPCVAQSS